MEEEEVFFFFFFATRSGVGSRSCGKTGSDLLGGWRIRMASKAARRREKSAPPAPPPHPPWLGRRLANFVWGLAGCGHASAKVVGGHWGVIGAIHGCTSGEAGTCPRRGCRNRAFCRFSFLWPGPAPGAVPITHRASPGQVSSGVIRGSGCPQQLFWAWRGFLLLLTCAEHLTEHLTEYLTEYLTVL